MKAVLTRFTPYKGIGLYIGDHEVFVSQVASTPLRGHTHDVGWWPAFHGHLHVFGVEQVDRQRTANLGRPIPAAMPAQFTSQTPP